MTCAKPMVAIALMIHTSFACLAAAPNAEGDPAAVGPTVGRPAPGIELSALLNAPSGARVSSDALRGKVVVVEFWATWCGPCVASIPLMNKLEDEYADEPVVFLHVTDEDEETVQEFLADRPIHGWVGIDKDRTTFTNFGVSGRPTTVVIGKDGRFLGWTHPAILGRKSSILRHILATGTSSELIDTPGTDGADARTLVRGKTEDTKDYLCDIVVRPARAGFSKSNNGGDSYGYAVFDEPLIGQIASFCSTPRANIVATEPLPEDHYDIVVRSPRFGTPGFKETVCRLIELSFGLSMSREERMMPVSLLRTLPGREPILTRSLGVVSTDEATGLHAPTREILERMKKGETFFFAMGPIDWLPRSLSRFLGKPVLLESGDRLENVDRVFYMFSFPYDPDDPEGLRKALEQHIGLTLVPGEREVPVLVVRREERKRASASGN